MHSTRKLHKSAVVFLVFPPLPFVNDLVDAINSH